MSQQSSWYLLRHATKYKKKMSILLQQMKSQDIPKVSGLHLLGTTDAKFQGNPSNTWEISVKRRGLIERWTDTAIPRGFGHHRVTLCQDLDLSTCVGSHSTQWRVLEQDSCSCSLHSYLPLEYIRWKEYFPKGINEVSHCYYHRHTLHEHGETAEQPEGIKKLC